MHIKNLPEYLKLAAVEAKKSPMIKKHGAVLIYRGKIISKGYNNYSSTNGIHTQYCLLHTK